MTDQKIVRKISVNGKIRIENQVSSLYYNGLAKNNGDATCVLHCLNSLKSGGRMALVVPEGFLFKENLKNLEREKENKKTGAKKNILNRTNNMLSMKLITFIPL